MLHVERGGWTFTALYSNTVRAHELGRTRDWVVIYYERDDGSGQCTVVTEPSGALRGQRVVRGRESELPAARAENLQALDPAGEPTVSSASPRAAART